MTGDDSRIDPAVVEALYHDHASDLRAFLAGVLRNADLVGEALQATFAKTLEAGHEARQETFRSWLFRVALHEALAIKRRQKLHDKSLGQHAWNASRHNPSPDELASRSELAQQVRIALDLLPPEQLQIVRLRIYEDKTFAAIAEQLGLPLGTVLTRMRIALRRLEEILRNKQ
jgi:RNA polymerase sigma-70 factor (ECF subfamily)